MTEEKRPTFRVTDRRGESKEELPTPDAQPNPELTFSSFILSLSTSAIIHMGLDPKSKAEKNLGLARQELDILGMLEEKTKGNLTADEAQIVREILYELRLRFVEVSKA